MSVQPDGLILDAMGVLYTCGDDIAELLIPYLREKGVEPSRLEQAKAGYDDIRLGRIPTSEYWARLGLPPETEDEHLSHFRLTDGLIPFLEKARGCFREIHCLSNDASEWSRKLRKRFGLDSYIDRWFISGDMKRRKPDPEIYLQMLQALGNPDPRGYLFVDDRVKNLDAAAALGIQTVLFIANSPGEEARNTRHPVARTFEQIFTIVQG